MIHFTIVLLIIKLIYEKLNKDQSLKDFHIFLETVSQENLLLRF